LLAPRAIDPTKPHADLLVTAQGLLSSCGYKVELMLICGHQDNRHPTVLSRDAWLNVEADVLAKQKVETPHMGPAYYKLPRNLWGCYIGTQCIVKQFNITLQTFVNGNNTMNYWAKQKNLSPQTIAGDRLDFTQKGYVRHSIIMAVMGS